MCKNGQFGNAENLAPWIFFIFPYPAPEGRTDTLKMSYIPQLLAEYIQYKYIYIYSTDTCSPTQRPEGRTDTLQLSYIPQLLAEYIQYKYIYLADTYSLIVGSVYPI